MKHTFLHLSDLHYRANSPEAADLLATRLLDDVKTQLHSVTEPHLIFSGDLVIAGQDQQTYTAFEERFSMALQDAAIPPSRRVAVPGNHDVSRTALQPILSIQKGTIQEMTSEQLFNDDFPQLAKTIFTPKFENYAACESRFAAFRCCDTSVGGRGWGISETVGIYCLNTALCSFGGLADVTGKPISDKGKLLIDTRSLHRWIVEEPYSFRILVMHHPLDWLADWASIELEQIIADSFQLVFSGHVHRASSVYSSRGAAGSVQCVAPPLFTAKSDLLGYSIATIDDITKSVDIRYRQWTPQHKFVAGTSLAGNDTAILHFAAAALQTVIEPPPPQQAIGTTLEILQAEFNEATTSYAAKRTIWVARDLSNIPETRRNDTDAPVTSPLILATAPRHCIIRAPAQFGLTSLGRFIALEHFKASTNGTLIVMADTTAIPAHRQGVIKHIADRCAQLGTTTASLTGIILDNWSGDKASRKILRELKSEFSGVPIILLNNCQDFGDIGNVIEADELTGTEVFFLWALSSARIRELVTIYTKDMLNLDETLVTRKVISDIDALNIHRSPSNCLMILRLLEQSFDDSPVNRTEMIGRVLYLLFYEFDKIPRYATRPDLKDCEYAIGYVSEWLIRNSKTSFTKTEFYAKVGDYCRQQLLELDCEVLFAFLVTENVLVRKGVFFEFRFTYWLYFFAAHRMHHDPQFAQFILTDHRYSSTPEIIEFYTGIDRRRTDAVTKLTGDLEQMNLGLLQRLSIPDDLNPFQHALWEPDQQSIAAILKQLNTSVAGSSLPAAVKDAIADQHYDRSKPYNQELAKFMTDSTLNQLVQTMRGAARALRNSDHVLPETKRLMLEEVLRSWKHVCQVLFILSPVLASRSAAAFEDMRFHLDRSFDKVPLEKRWNAIMSVIPENVVRYYQDDLFSKKMGPLLTNFVQKYPSRLETLLVLLVLVRQRPPGWDREIERFIVGTKKNSFALAKVYNALHSEFTSSFANEATRQQLRRLAAMAIAKHQIGVKHPNAKLVEQAAQFIDKDARRHQPPPNKKP